MMAAPALPKWIFFYGCFLAVIGFATAMIGLFAPTMFFNDFPDFDQWEEISFVTNTFGIRNLAMCAALVTALWLRAPAAIAVAFGMRSLTELGDILNTVFTGHGTMGAPIPALLIGGFALFVIPEALAARWGMRATLADRHRS
ncbi:MAG: hypothetical protein AAF626_01915 [Pseudomonadota bacterium]